MQPETPTPNPKTRTQTARRYRDKLLVSVPILLVAWETYDKQVSFHKTGSRRCVQALQNVQNAETYTVNLLLKTIAFCVTREGVERVRKSLREVSNGAIDIDGGMNHMDGLQEGEWNVRLSRPCSEVGSLWWDRQTLPEESYRMYKTG